MQAVERRRGVTPEYLEEAVRDKEALAYLLAEKAMNTGDERTAQFYYVVSSFLRRLPVREMPGAVLATDGEAFYVGEKYLLVKRKYGARVLPFIWMHEVLHVLHVHPERMMLVDDPNLYNIIADLYINDVLERRVGSIPDDFVKLSTFIAFLIKAKGRLFTDEEREALEELARLVVEERVTVEEAYAVIEKIPAAREEMKKAFRSSAFFGRDLPSRERERGGREENGGKRDGRRGGQGETHGEQRGRRGGAGGEDEMPGRERGPGGHGSIGRLGGARPPALPEPDRGTEELRRTLERIRRRIDETLSEYHKALGEFKALRRHIGARPGTEPGVYGQAEYNELMRLRVKLEQILLREIGRVVQEYEVNFSRFDRDAYWLPEDREVYKSRVKVFLDTSGSIPLPVAKLFMSWVNSAVKKYNVSVEVVVFSVGVLAKYEIGERRARLDRIPLGGGTVWEESIARELVKAAREEVPLIVVLSDFMIDVRGEARRAIQVYKRRGGRISCWSIYGFSDFCDYRHKLPKAFKALSRAPA